MAASIFAGLTVNDAQLAEDLTLRGIAVEGIYSLGEGNGSGNGSLFEMDITTNRVDAMNHYGVAREAATIYGLGTEAARISAACGAAMRSSRFLLRLRRRMLAGGLRRGCCAM